MTKKKTPVPEPTPVKKEEQKEATAPNPPEGMRVGKLKLEVSIPPRPTVITIRTNSVIGVNLATTQHGDIKLSELIGALSLILDEVKEAARKEGEFKLNLYALKQAESEKVEIKSDGIDSIEWMKEGFLGYKDKSNEAP